MVHRSLRLLHLHLRDEKDKPLTQKHLISLRTDIKMVYASRFNEKMENQNILSKS